jgi:hypothetical protein
VGFDLKNVKTGNCCSFNVTAWSELLDLAKHCGWKPAGTTKPKRWKTDETWNGYYGVNDGATVTAEDAAAIADALEAALVNIPASHEEARNCRLLPCEHAFVGYHHVIRKMIEFCRQGAFEIW